MSAVCSMPGSPARPTSLVSRAAMPRRRLRVSAESAASEYEERSSLTRWRAREKVSCKASSSFSPREIRSMIVEGKCCSHRNSARVSLSFKKSPCSPVCENMPSASVSARASIPQTPRLPIFCTLTLTTTIRPIGVPTLERRTMSHFLHGVAAMLLFIPFATGQSKVESVLDLPEFVHDWEISRQFTLDVANAMPAELYSFKPNPEEMTFGEQI